MLHCIYMDKSRKLLFGLGLVASGMTGMEREAGAKPKPTNTQKAAGESKLGAPTEKRIDIQELKTDWLLLLEQYFHDDKEAIKEMRIEMDRLLAEEKDPLKQLELIRKFYEDRRLVALRQSGHSGGRKGIEAEAQVINETMLHFLSPTVPDDEALRGLAIIIPENHEISWNGLITIRRGKGLDFYEGNRKIDAGTRQDIIQRYLHLLKIRQML